MGGTRKFLQHLQITCPNMASGDCRLACTNSFTQQASSDSYHSLLHELASEHAIKILHSAQNLMLGSTYCFGMSKAASKAKNDQSVL